MDLIVIWLAPVLGRCNSFSFNGLTTASHQMKWNKFWVQYIYIKQWKTCNLYDISFLISLLSFFPFYPLTKVLACCVGRHFLFLLAVGILFAVSCVWVPVQDKGMALLWLGSFVPALHWGTSQQFWTHFSSLGVEGRKQSMCAQQRQTFQTWLISPYSCCANSGCCEWNGAVGSKSTRNKRKETKERSSGEDRGSKKLGREKHQAADRL